MPSLLRFERRPEAGWILAEGPTVIGEIHPDRMVFTGFRDTSSCSVAASIAARVLRQWQSTRSATAGDEFVVTLTDDGLGFTFPLREPLWHAVLFELAQRVHGATHSLRSYAMEGAV